MTSIVIFYNVQKWIDNEDDIFDIRSSAHTLPRGSAGCGFLMIKGEEIVELLDPPYLGDNSEHERNWNSVVREARRLLQDEL